MSVVPIRRQGMTPVTFYEQIVAPVVFERLDAVFPELGLVRDQRGWRATNEDATHAFFGARAERVVCHKIGGFYIYGAGAVPWLAHLGAGDVPRGRDYVEAVRRLAQTVGVDTSPIEHPAPRAAPGAARLRDVRETYFKRCVETYQHTKRGAAARAYLAERAILGTNAAEITGLLGVAPHASEARRLLSAAGFTRGEVEASGVLADARWTGRIVGAWRDEQDRIATLWARATNHDTDAAQRYLYLRGATRPALPYLASRVRSREVVIVEGVLDALALQAHGCASAVALGGSSASEATWSALARHGIRHATLCLDYDATGDRASRSATHSALRAAEAPHLLIRSDDPNAHEKDFAALFAHLRDHDPAAYADLQTPGALASLIGSRATGAVEYEIRAILNEHEGKATRNARQAAFDAAVSFLARVPDTHALAREDAIQLLAGWARLDPATIKRLTHQGENAAGLRTRVVELEAAIGLARGLIAEARLPIPTQTASTLGHTLDAHERLVDAHRALSLALPAIPTRSAPSPLASDPRQLPERSLR